MLERADLDLIARDRALPGLGYLLDPERLVECLTVARPTLRLTDLHLTYLRYKPGTNCLAGYRVTVEGQIIDLLVKALPAGSRRLARAAEAPAVAGPCGSGRLVVTDPALVVSFFPNDDKLPGLVCLADAEARQRLLRQLLPEQPILWSEPIERLVYKAERRYVGRLGRHAAPGAVLRFQTPAAFEASLGGATAFQSAGLGATRGGASPRLATCLGFDPGLSLMAVEWLTGDLLNGLMHDSTTLDELVLDRVGAALAELHAAEPIGLAHNDRSAEAASLMAVADGLAPILPALADRAGGLALRLATWLAARPEMARPLHGDFYSKQVLINGQAIAFLDLDEVHRGDPLLDLANFVAHLERDRLRGMIDQRQCAAWTTRLIDGYLTAGGQPMIEHLAPYTAARLLRLAPHPFRHREPDWSGRTAALLERVAELTEQIGSGTARQVVGSSSHGRWGGGE